MADDAMVADDQESITVELSREVHEALLEIAKRRGVSLERAILDAIGSDLFILREAGRGNKILIQRPDRSVKELLVEA